MDEDFNRAIRLPLSRARERMPCRGQMRIGRSGAAILLPFAIGRRILRCPRVPRQVEAFILKNLLTDIAGVRVGHADDPKLASGVTAIVFDRPAVGAIDVRGGAPGTREEPLLRPESRVETIDAIALSGR